MSATTGVPGGGSGSSGGRRASSAARWVNAPCGMTVTRAGSRPSSPVSRRAAVLGVHDDVVDALVEAALGAQLARARLARQDVVGGQDGRARARQQVDVERLDGEPLEVDDVGRARRAPVGHHVGHVLGELGGEPRARADRADPAARR